jgi:hypothetical protein
MWDAVSVVQAIFRLKAEAMGFCFRLQAEDRASTNQLTTIVPPIISACGEQL